MKLSTEAKAGVMVAVSFLGLSGVLVGKKFLDPENPIEALHSEQKKPDQSDAEKDKDIAAKKPESSDPNDPKATKDKNGEIVLAKNQVQAPGAFPPIGETNPSSGAGKSTPPADSNPFPPFNPVPGSNPGNGGSGIPVPGNTNSGLPPLPGMENNDPSKNGNRALVKNDPPKGDGSLAFPLPENKSPTNLPGNPAPAPTPKSDLPPLNQGSSNAFPAFPPPTKANETSGSGVPGNLTNAQAGKNPLDPKTNLPTNDPKNPFPGADPKSKSAFPDPFPPLPGGTNSPNSLPGSGTDNKFKDPGLPKPTEPAKNAFPDFPPLNSQGTTNGGAPSNLGGSSTNGGLGGLDNKKPAPFPSPNGDIGANGDSRFPPPNNLPGDNSSLGRKPFPGDSSPPLNGSGLGTSNGRGSFGNPNNPRTSSGFPSGSNLPGGDTLGNNNPFPRNDAAVIPASRPIAKPVVTTFSPLTGPTKRTEFTPLDDDPPPVAAPLNPVRTNPSTPTMNQPLGNQPLGQPPGSLGQNAPPVGGFPLPGGSGAPTNSGLPGNPARDPFPPVNSPSSLPQNNPLPGPGNPPPSGVKPAGSSTPPPSGFPSLDSASRTNRPEPFPLNSPATNGANIPVLKMPAEEKPLINSGIQPTGLQMPSLNSPVAPAPGNLGNSLGSFPATNPGTNPGLTPPANPRTSPAPANAPFPAPTNPTFPAPTGKNLLNPKVSSWSEKVYQSAPGDSWETIAAREYQRNDLGRLLETYNGLHPRADALPKTGPLPAKTEVFLPPLDELIRRGTGEVPMNLFPPAKP